jgi:lysosomal acid lipase/cholesteryl ester hydrolase
MAEKDLPTMIECALKISSQKDLIYIGHSQGTIIAFSQLGINSRLASQIKLFIAMGPVAQVSHIKSPIKLLANIGSESKQLIWYKVFGKKDFMPSSALTEWMSSEFCNIEVTF